MALYANTTSDVVHYVSRKDPARGQHKPVWVDEKDKTKGEVLSDADIEVFRQAGATVFAVKPLDVFLMGYIYDRASVLRGDSEQNIDIHTRMNQTNLDAARFGLVGIENFPTRDGGYLKFEDEDVVVNGREYKAAKPMVLTAIRDITVIQELAERVRQISEVSGTEEKNFGSGSLLPG